MKSLKFVWFAPVALSLALAGCETPGGGNGPSQTYPSPSQSYPSSSYPAQYQSTQVGYVERIELIKSADAGASNNIAGTVIGGIVGGLIGSQIGGGSGQTAATIVGAAGGAIAGNTIQGRRRADNESFRVTVRLENGSYQTVTQADIRDLRTGDRVRLEGNQIRRI